MGRHSLRKDRTNLYRRLLLTTAMTIASANILMLTSESPAIPSTSTINHQSPITATTLALAIQEPTPSPTPIPTTSTQPATTTSPTPVPTTTTTTPPPPPETTTTTTPPPPPPPAPKEESCSTNLKRTVPHVAQAGRHIMSRFGILEAVVGGRASRGRASDHPSGHALDFSVNRVTGDQIAEYALENADLLSVKYVIWRQRIAYPGGDWKRMEDRGNRTANHYDHVHISFLSKDTGNPTC